MGLFFELIRNTYCYQLFFRAAIISILIPIIFKGIAIYTRIVAISNHDNTYLAYIESEMNITPKTKGMKYLKGTCEKLRNE